MCVCMHVYSYIYIYCHHGKRYKQVVRCYVGPCGAISLRQNQQNWVKKTQFGESRSPEHSFFCIELLVGGFNPSEEYEFVSWDDYSQDLFQTTNQIAIKCGFYGQQKRVSDMQDGAP